MGVVGAAGILDFESILDELRMRGAHLVPGKSIYQPDMLEQTYHKFFMKEGW